MSLRTLLLVVALLCTLLAGHANCVRREQRGLKALIRLQIHAVVASSAPDWLPRWFDGPWFQHVVAVNMAQPGSKRAAAGVEFYQAPYDPSRGFSNVELFFVMESAQLSEWERPEAPAITDDVLAIIADLPECHALGLYKAKISDAGVTHLLKMRKLRYLDLTNTRISDAGASSLACCSSLHCLVICGTNISDEGSRRLCRALPACSVHR